MYTTNLSHLNLASKGFQHVTLGGQKTKKQSRNKQKMNQEERIMKISHNNNNNIQIIEIRKTNGISLRWLYVILIIVITRVGIWIKVHVRICPAILHD